VARSVIGTASMILDPNVLASNYSAVVLCEIDPTSTADYCRVFARDGATTVESKLLLHMRTCVHAYVYAYKLCMYRSSKIIHY